MWYEYPGVLDRLRSKVKIDGECHIWQGGKAGPGYGTFRISRPTRRYAYAHRLMLEFKIKRELRQGEYALHSCDRPLCVNPDHLRLGTQRDNMSDAHDRGRIARGKAVGGKLSDQDVREIRALLKVLGTRQQDIADRYGVCRPVISYISSGRSYRHVR
jgi:hypothetical protein